MNNWRDCGWSIGCHRGSSQLEIVLSQIQDDQWILQVSPQRVPGIISGLFGRKVSASADTVQELALDVHRSLSSVQYFDAPLWCWDGFPDDTNASHEPQQAEQTDAGNRRSAGA